MTVILKLHLLLYADDTVILKLHLLLYADDTVILKLYLLLYADDSDFKASAIIIRWWQLS